VFGYVWLGMVMSDVLHVDILWDITVCDDV